MLAVLVVLAVTGSARGEVDDEQFREEVIVCEEALARLVGCCPGLDGNRVLCTYRHESTGGCTDGTADYEDPALSLPESRCILDMSCEDLRSRDVCGRAAEAKTYITRRRSSSGEVTDAGSRSHPPVCP